jgi:hypothetical protein
MGLWLRGPASTLADYGLTTFAATDGTTPPPPGAPENVRILKTAARRGGVPFVSTAADALAILLPGLTNYAH